MNETKDQNLPGTEPLLGLNLSFGFTSVREVVKDLILKMSICDQASPDHLGTLAKKV